jgi:hypothetical protein
MENLILRVHIPVWVEDQDQFEMVGVDQEDVLENLAGFDRDNEKVVWDIDIETGTIQNWNGKEVNLFDKLCDEGTFELIYDGNVIAQYEHEYVPDFLCIGTEGYGDYIALSINEDGIIKDWNYYRCPTYCYEFFGVITPKDIEKYGSLLEYYQHNYDPYEEGKQVFRPNSIILAKNGTVSRLDMLIEDFIKNN